MGEAWLGAVETPDGEGNDGREQDGGDEEGGDLVGEALDGGAGALGLRDHLDDLGEQGVGADALGLHDERSGGVESASGEGGADGLLDRDRLASNHGLIDRGAAFEDDAVDRDLFAGAYAEAVAGVDLGEVDVRVGVISGNATGSAGGEAEQGPDSRAGLGAGFELEHLAEQDEDDDDGGGLKVEAEVAGHIAEGGGKQAGRDDGGEAIDVGGAGAKGNKGKHVEAAMDDGGVAALKKGPASPEDDGRGEEELEPGESGVLEEDVEGVVGEEAEHHDGEQGEGEAEADPEPLGHADELGVGGVGGGGAGLESHAADRAGAGRFADDLGVHGAGVLGAGGGRIDWDRGPCRTWGRAAGGR